MPTPYNQSWARGFSPLFGSAYSDQHIRVSDAERQAVTDRLAWDWLEFVDMALVSTNYRERD